MTERERMIIEFYEDNEIPKRLIIKEIIRKIRRKIYEFRNINKMDRVRHN